MRRANTRQASKLAIGSRTATGEQILILQFVNSPCEEERGKERFMLPRTFHLAKIRERERGTEKATSCLEVRDTGADTLLNPGLFVAGRCCSTRPPAYVVASLTAGVSPNCLRQQPRELTRRNHLLSPPLVLRYLPISKPRCRIRPGLIWGFGGLGSDFSSAGNETAREIRSGVMLSAKSESHF